MYTVGSLFAGVGGADKGLEMAGFRTVWGIERDLQIAEYAQLNFPHANIINDCVGNVRPHKLALVDLLWMSPPCQDYSNARRGNLAPHPDKDAGLYCGDFIAAIDPRWVVLENVPAYVNSPVFEKILKDLNHLRYRYFYKILNASDYSVPQDRERLIMWAVRRGERLPFFPISSRRVGWYEAISHLIPDLPNTILADWQIKRLEAIGSNKQDYPILMPRAGANVNNSRPYLHSEPCPTIRSLEAGRHTHWADIIGKGMVKKITPGASALLQSFPTDFIFPPIKTLAQKMIGNAVPPLLAKAIGQSIIESIT